MGTEAHLSIPKGQRHPSGCPASPGHMEACAAHQPTGVCRCWALAVRRARSPSARGLAEPRRDAGHGAGAYLRLILRRRMLTSTAYCMRLASHQPGWSRLQVLAGSPVAWPAPQRIYSVTLFPRFINFHFRIILAMFSPKNKNNSTKNSNFVFLFIFVDFLKLCSLFLAQLAEKLLKLSYCSSVVVCFVSETEGYKTCCVESVSWCLRQELHLK